MESYTRNKFDNYHLKAYNNKNVSQMHKIKAEGNRAPLIQKSVFTFYISLKGNRLNFLVKRYRLGKWNLNINRYMLPRESKKTSVIW